MLIGVNLCNKTIDNAAHCTYTSILQCTCALLELAHNACYSMTVAIACTFFSNSLTDQPYRFLLLVISKKASLYRNSMLAGMHSSHVMFDFFCSEKQMLERELLVSKKILNRLSLPPPDPGVKYVIFVIYKLVLQQLYSCYW